MAKAMNKIRIDSKLGPNLRPTSKLKYLAIVEAARKQFLQHGFAAANMDTIAEVANVSKRTVYKHFQDKQALFGAVVQAMCENVAPPSMEDFQNEEASLQDVLTQLGVHFLTNIYRKEQIELYRAVVADAHRFPELGDLMFGAVTRSEHFINSYFAEQKKLKNIRLPCPEMAASQFLGLLKTNVQMKLLFGQQKSVSTAEIRKIARCCADLFVNGCEQRK